MSGPSYSRTGGERKGGAITVANADAEGALSVTDRLTILGYGAHPKRYAEALGCVGPGRVARTAATAGEAEPSLPPPKSCSPGVFLPSCTPGQGR